MATFNLDRTGAGRSLSVARGDTVVVRLDEIPTSGYRWEVAGIDPNVLQLSGDEYIPSARAGIGGGGQRELQFAVVGPGQSELRLIRRRSWEPETEAVEELRATIIATG